MGSANRFTGKTVIITGSGSGIGRATALAFAHEGANVVIADFNPNHGKEVSDAINKIGGRSEFILCNVSLESDIQNLVSTSLQKYGAIDIVVNNAAVMTFSPLVETTSQDWDRVLATNLKSVFLLSKYALPHIRKGSIVNISSVHAHQTTANNSPYAAAKGGVEALTRALSLEIDSAQCRINALAPGAVDTPMLWSNPNIKSGKEKITGHIAKAEEIASAILFLASSEASFLHGTTLIADGGRLAAL